MSSCSDPSGSQQHHLPTTTTFLPILDDLLSPDFRPVTYPPVITPLQTPTTAVLPTSNAASSSAAGDRGKSEDVAAVKIQKWWKNSRRGSDLGDIKEERVKHSVRHRRAEEHIRALESEVTRLKSSLATERKLRSLQYEAIRSLWSQVQKLTVNNPNNDLPPNASSIMSQSLPNGLPPQPQLPNGTQHCNCTTAMTSAVQKLEDEISELRTLIMQTVVKEEPSAMDSSTSSGSTKANKRPDSLDLNGGAKTGVNAKPEEIQGYANEMAKFVVERGISDNVEGGGDGK